MQQAKKSEASSDKSKSAHSTPTPKQPPIISRTENQKPKLEIQSSPPKPQQTNTGIIIAKEAVNEMKKEKALSIEEIDLKIKMLEAKKKEELRAQRSKDLAKVREICKQHGFTQRMLRGALADGRERKAGVNLVGSV